MNNKKFPPQTNGQRETVVVLKDGRKTALGDLHEIHPRCGPLHVPEVGDLCLGIAQAYIPETGVKQQILANIFQSQSPVVQGLLLVKAMDNLRLLKSLHCGSLSPGLIHSLDLHAEIVGQEADEMPPLFGRTKTAKMMLVFLIVHYLYRWVGRCIPNRRPKDPSTLIRAWVELSERLRPHEFPLARVWIYPFKLNLGRHLRFIRACRKQKRAFRLHGIPYPLAPLWNLLRGARSAEEAWTDFEHQGFIRHAEDICKIGVSRVLTTDEFQPAALALYQKLRDKGIFSSNAAHGIGRYAPFTSYDEFLAFNYPQAVYYQNQAPHTQFQVPDRPLHVDIEAIFPAGPVPVILFDQQDLRALGYGYEAEVQTRLYNAFSEIESDSRFVPIIKVHPNDSDQRVAWLTSLFPAAEIIRNDQSLPGGGWLSINLFSTCYYDYIDRGPMIFIRDGYFDARFLFGSEIVLSNPKDLKKTLVEFLDHSKWVSYYENLRSHKSSL